MTGWSPGSGGGVQGVKGQGSQPQRYRHWGLAVLCEDVERHPWPYLPKTYNQKRLRALPSRPWQVNWSLVADYRIRELFRA